MKKILTAVATVAALSANPAVAEESFELQTKGFLKRLGGTRGHWEVTLSSTIGH